MVIYLIICLAGMIICGVITKTKDQTIYQLKSSIEEQKLTIETLQNQTESNDPKKIRIIRRLPRIPLPRLFRYEQRFR